MAIKIRNVENLTLGKPDTGAANSNVAIGIEAVDTTEFELAISRPTQEQKFQFAINNEGTADGTNYGGIAFTQGASAETIMASIKVDYTDTDNYPNLVFGTRSTSDALTILDDGSVSTNGRLDVNSDTVKLYNGANTNNTYFFVENSGVGNAGVKMKNSQGEWTVIANDRLRFISDDSPTTEVLSLHPDGKVGIGTGTGALSSLLHIKQSSGSDSIMLDIESNNDGGIRFGRAGHGSMITHRTSTPDYMAFHVEGSVQPTFPGTPKMVITDTGDVGVGSINPNGYKLKISNTDVYTTTTAAEAAKILLLRLDSTITDTQANPDVVQTQQWDFKVDWDKRLHIDSASSTGGIIFNAGTWGYEFNDGNVIVNEKVGIGTTSTLTELLEVNGNAKATKFIGALEGNADTVTTNANLTGDVTSVGNATSIATGVIVNADIKSDAAIAYSKLGAIPTWNQDTTGNAATATALETTRDITIGSSSSQEAGDIDGITNSFDGSANISFDSKLFDHLASFIDPTANPQAQIDASAGVNMTAVAQGDWAHEIIIGSSTVYPTLKINRKGQIIGFKEESAGQGGGGGVGRITLITHGKLYTNAERTAQNSGFLSPTNGDIDLNFYLKDAALGGSLVVGSGANLNKIGLQAVDGTTSLGYITVPYATTAGSANGGAADTINTIQRDVSEVVPNTDPKTYNNNTSHYLTFVNDNNSAAAAESLFTDANIFYNPHTNTLSTGTVAATSIGTTNLTANPPTIGDKALVNLLGYEKDDGNVVNKITDTKVKSWLGLGSMAYEATGSYYTQTAANTAFAAASHNHDSRYYTETEIDTKIATLNTSIGGKQATITGGATTITGSNLTASRALVSNSSGKVAVSAVTSTELGYLDGVTSAVQTQLNSLGASISTNATNISSNDTDISNLSNDKQDALSNTSSVSINDLTAVKTLTWPPACCPPDPQHTMNDVGIKAFSIAPYGTLSQPTFRSMPSTFRTVDGSVLGLHNSNALGYTVAWHWAYINNIQTVLPVLEMSDRREKENIEPIHLGLDFVNKLNPVSYHLKSAETPRKQLGLIADEVVEVLDEYGEGIDKESIVYEIPKGSPNSRMAVGYTDLIAPLIKSVQELSAKVESLQSRIEELEK